MTQLYRFCLYNSHRKKGEYSLWCRLILKIMFRILSLDRSDCDCNWTIGYQRKTQVNWNVSSCFMSGITPFCQQSSKPTLQRPSSKASIDGGPFSNHCRTFDNQLKELSQQLMAVKERLSDLQRDVSVLKRANTPPLGTRYDHVARDCRLLEQQLEHHQIELERLRNVFDALWEEQVCRIHIEKEIFHSQVHFLDFL